jgi:hypothetical protein
MFHREKPPNNGERRPKTTLERRDLRRVLGGVAFAKTAAPYWRRSGRSEFQAQVDFWPVHNLVNAKAAVEVVGLLLVDVQ